LVMLSCALKKFGPGLIRPWRERCWSSAVDWQAVHVLHLAVPRNQNVKAGEARRDISMARGFLPAKANHRAFVTTIGRDEMIHARSLA
jgi:hypothetical protein